MEINIVREKLRRLKCNISCDSFLLSDSFTLPSSANSLTKMYKVGTKAVLPCSWRSRLSVEGDSACHIQWLSPPDIVFEQQGEARWETEDLKGRAEVLAENLSSGDCSLIINDVQIADSGKYESFMLVDGAGSKKSWVFIQSVRLSVTG